MLCPLWSLNSYLFFFFLTVLFVFFVQDDVESKPCNEFEEKQDAARLSDSSFSVKNVSYLVYLVQYFMSSMSYLIFLGREVS